MLCAVLSVKSEVTKQKEQRESRGNEEQQGQIKKKSKKPIYFFGFVSHRVEVCGAKNKTFLTFAFLSHPSISLSFSILIFNFLMQDSGVCVCVLYYIIILYYII